MKWGIPYVANESGCYIFQSIDDGEEREEEEMLRMKPEIQAPMMIAK